MVLKFDDVVYKKTFEIQAKDEAFEFVVTITDEESVELADNIVNLLMGKGEDDDINKILFKSDLDKVNQLLVGHNFMKFRTAVLTDIQDFLQGSIEEITKTVKGL